MEKWYSLAPDFPMYEINENGEVRRIAHKKVNHIRCFDANGDLVDEQINEIEHPPKPMNKHKKNGTYVLYLGGKMYNRSPKKLYKKFVLGIEPYKYKRYRKSTRTLTY